MYRDTPPANHAGQSHSLWLANVTENRPKFAISGRQIGPAGTGLIGV